jgi:hypothetical protein
VTRIVGAADGLKLLLEPRVLAEHACGFVLKRTPERLRGHHHKDARVAALAIWSARRLQMP